MNDAIQIGNILLDQIYSNYFYNYLYEYYRLFLSFKKW